MASLIFNKESMASPFTIFFFFLFFFGLIFLFAFVQVGLITLAFEKIGLGPNQVFAFLLLSLLGSYINIPIKKIENRQELPFYPERITFFGISYNIPQWTTTQTIVAINLGGAVIPILLSIYLMLKWHIFFEPVVATSLVAVISYFLAKPVPGLGIAMPIFIPPLLAAIVALALSKSGHAPAVAYIAGTIGTLIGADILHLKDIHKLKSPIVSIGGAGTFDGIFLAGIIAVLLTHY